MTEQNGSDDLTLDERRVEREAVLDAPPEEVWESLTNPARLEEWLADDVEMDPVEGGEVNVRDGDDERSGVVEEVVERERISFTWARPDAEPSRVEFAIEGVPGGTRIVVTETATAPTGWEGSLLRLSNSLALVAA